MSPVKADSPRLEPRRCRFRERRRPAHEKVVLTGDDIIEEYIKRMIDTIKRVNEKNLKAPWKRAISRFVNHQVWMSDVHPEFNLVEKLTIRLGEMKQKKRKLAFAQQRANHTQFYASQEASKARTIQRVSSQQLEELLKTHTRQAALELVSCLIDDQGKGVLSSIIVHLLTQGKVGGAFGEEAVEE